MYVQATGGFTKILGQIVAFQRTGSLLVSGLTAGIKTRKENVQLLGPHAQTVVGGKPVFSASRSCSLRIVWEIGIPT